VRLPTYSELVIGLMRRLLRGWVQTQVVAPEAFAAAIDRGQPVCYALQFRQLSALLVLDEETRRHGLPVPLAPLSATGAGTGDATTHAAAATGRLLERHAFFYLTASGQPSPLKSQGYRYAPRLARLVSAVRADPSLDVQIVPVNVFWGRAPKNQDSIVKALLAEGWAIPGSLRQLMRVMIHGRQTLLKFGEPISLRATLQDDADDVLPVRRVARLLRADFRLERERVIGPNLSHRFTLINAVVAAPAVQQAIEDEVRVRRVVRDKAERSARRYAWEIASNYSYPFIRAFDLALQLLWNRLYDGVSVFRFADVREAAAGATVVYVPCHRSHIDYLLLSFLIYYEGLPPPHVAAGANLNLPVVGPLLRRGGAFFLRRSFKGLPLYGAVFGEYLHEMIRRGFAIEYFVEGGRSRTGRTLAPKAGLLAMTVESWLREPQRPVVFVPVYIGYERVLEGDTYIAELSGKPKQKESLLGLVRSARKLREHFGQVHVNVGEPIRLASWIEPFAPLADAARQRAAVDRLALEIVTRINDAVVVNPVNLVSLAMLAAPRHAMDAEQLAGQIDLLRALIGRVPYSARLQLTALDGAQVVARAERTGLLARIAHPLGDVLQVAPGQAALLAYFRNNVLHAYAIPALLACLLSQNPSIPSRQLQEISRRVFPFLRAELFLSWDDASLGPRIEDTLHTFVELGLITPEPGTESRFGRPAPGAAGSIALHSLAQVIRQPLERFFITLAVLTDRGSGTMSPAALEDLCYLLAQRMSFLHETGSPEFFDRAPFRSIIATLGELGWVHTVEGLLSFGVQLQEAAADADALLSSEVRLAIAQVTRLSPEDVKRAEQAFARS